MSLRDLSQRLVVPGFEITLPLSQQRVKFRPWQVGDKKAILIALQDKNPIAVRNAVFEVLRKCVTSEEVAIENLAATDLTYLLLHVRARSDNDLISINLQVPPSRCGLKETEDNGEEFRRVMAEGCLQRLRVNVMEVAVENLDRYTSKIALSDTIGIAMRPPTLEHTEMYFSIQDHQKTSDAKTAVEEYYRIVAACIDYIWDENTIYKAVDTPPEELIEFINSLNDTQFAKIEKWFETLPQLYSNQKWTCKRCGKTFEHSFRGVQDFFG